MKTFLATLLLAVAGFAQAGACGYPPYPPFGFEYICVCDQNAQNCHWILVSKK